jgi:N-hydroxyarylamine O-acetyltransferase
VFSAEKYLERIGMSTEVGAPTLELLAALQLAHLTHVPFENLHVFHRRGVRTDVEWSYPKIVEQRRGGWCFEVNGCFGALLREVGFDVDYISCRVWNEGEGWGPPFDHLGLLVRLDGGRWFVDVGFGDNCLVPLPVVDGEHSAVPRQARVEVDDETFVLTELMPDEGWLKQLHAVLKPMDLADFMPRSEYLKTAPNLGWSTKPFATRALDGEGSRLTLRRDLLRRRDGTGPYADTPVVAQEWSDLLLEHFGLVDSLTR